MALTLSLTTPQGFSTTEAYARIANWRGVKSCIQLTVNVYKDHDAAVAGLQPIDTQEFQLNLLCGATMQQMYDALKGEPYFLHSSDS